MSRLSSSTLSGLVMHSPDLPSEDPMRGEFVLCAINSPGTHTDIWRGWPQGRWWNSPMLFWDDFSDDGRLSAEPNPHNAVGVLSLQRTIAPGSSADFTFLLAWRFPNRTPEWCGWTAPKGQGQNRHRQSLLHPISHRARRRRIRIRKISRVSKVRPACSRRPFAKARCPPS